MLRIFSPLLAASAKNTYFKVLQIESLRYKSKNVKKVNSSESTSSETSSSEDDGIVDKNTKTMLVNVKSTRIDALIKSGLGIARNKVDTLFYESKIRINGKKLLKKSETAEEGDEIDVVKGPSPTNPEFLTVARVEILGITEKGEITSVKLRRCKNLIIENYDDVN